MGQNHGTFQINRPTKQASVGGLYANLNQPLVATESNRGGGVQFTGQRVNKKIAARQRVARARYNSRMRQRVKPSIFF